MAERMIELKNLTKRYDGETALDGIDLYIRRREFLTLLGPSGCGKTTMLRLIAGFEQADEGDILFEGQRINDLPPYKRRVNTVFQRYSLFPHMSVFDNVALPLRIRGMREKEIRQRVIELLAWVELSHNMYVKSSEISGGEKQRVAIARAVINRPELLLADEPTGNVDSDIAAKLMKLFAELNRLGTTVVIATHSNELMERYHYPRLQLADGNLFYAKNEERETGGRL